MCIDLVDNKIREPWALALSLEQTGEQFQAFLTEVVAKDFERHQGAVMSETLREEGQAEVVDLVVGHVQVDQGLVDCKCLRYRFGPVV